MQKVQNKKHAVLLDLYEHCQKNGDFVFHNRLVKAMSEERGFGNPFDVTKLDSSNKLPAFFKDNDICLLHLGEGNHKFIKGIANLYHQFEPMQESVSWVYKKSLLNEYNDSESNILSVANNQRILHDFVFGEDLEFENLPISKRPKIYFSHRTKQTLEYYFENEKIIAQNQQIEIDLTIEFDGIIAVFEAKNGKAKDFNIYQIYHPFLYYHYSKLNFKEIACVYLMRQGDILKLWKYTFENPLQLNSIKFLKSKEYILKRE